MKNKYLLILLIILFFKSLTWMLFTPIFQVPDEPSHFSIVQYISHQGQRPHPRRERPSSQEIIAVSKAINFNWQITHPVWQGYQSNWQEQINSILPQEKSSFIRNDYLTSLKRPPLYYFLATPFYLIFNNQSFLLRFFSVRFFSLIIGLFIAYFTYKSVKICIKSQSLSLAVTSLVGFQPMLSFLGVSAHYDPLAVLIVTIFTYLLLMFIKTKRIKFFRLSFLLAILGLLTKPDLLVLLLIWPFFLGNKKIKPILFIGIASFGALVLIFPVFSKIYANPDLTQHLDKFLYLINLNEYSSKAQGVVKLLISGNLFKQVINYFSLTFKANLAQVFPWYWGVFGWLEKTMPAYAYQSLKLISLVSIIGWLKALFLSKKLTLFTRRSLILLFSLSLAHFMIVVLNDFLTFASSGEIFGFQGRYLLPTITSHMILLFFGIAHLIPKSKYNLLAGLTITLSIALNLIGLYSLFQYFGNVWA